MNQVKVNYSFSLARSNFCVVKGNMSRVLLGWAPGLTHKNYILREAITNSIFVQECQ
jgi:hypothetical protein